MASEEAIAELKSLLLGLDTKVNTFSTKLDNIEDKFFKMLTEVKVEVGQVKAEIQTTQNDIHKLRQDHNELERGVGHIEVQLTSLETHKMELMRKHMDYQIAGLNEKLLLLEKHERKYNVLVYGVKENVDEKINDVVYNFMVNDLGIDSERADSIPIANAHRIPARQTPGQPKRINPIIIRFIHFGDKQFIMSKGSKLFEKKMRIVDDLPTTMKDARNQLANFAYKIRKEERLQTRIRCSGTRLILETRLNNKDKWQLREDYQC